MTDQELKDLVAGLARSQAETEKELREWREARKETERRLRESQEAADRQLRESRESREEAERLSRESREKADRQWQESREEAERQSRESRRETEREIRRVSKLIGDLGNNFGRFTEGMAEPSMRKLLKKFGMTAIHPRAVFHSKDGSRTMEVDVLGYDANDLREEVYIVEVKSRLTTDGIAQALETIADFRELGPVALRHRPIYGVIAAVDIPKDLDRAVTNRGLYLARINDDTFQLLTPRGFKPKAFLYEAPSNDGSGSRGNGHPKKKKSRKK